MGVFCANETLLNLKIDRRDLSLELEQFSYHCSRLRHTEALQPCPRTVLRSLLLLLHLLTGSIRQETSPGLTLCPTWCTDSGKVELPALRGSRAGKWAPALLLTVVLRV